MAFRVAGVHSLDARWVLHAVETTTALHYPNGAPRGIAEPLEKLRQATEDAAFYSDLIAMALWHDGAEGIEQLPFFVKQHDDATATTDADEDDDDEAGTGYDSESR